MVFLQLTFAAAFQFVFYRYLCGWKAGFHDPQEGQKSEVPWYQLGRKSLLASVDTPFDPNW